MNRISLVGVSIVVLIAVGCGAKDAVSHGEPKTEGTSMTRRSGIPVPPLGEIPAGQPPSTNPLRTLAATMQGGSRGFGGGSSTPHLQSEVPQAPSPNATVQGSYASKEGNEVRVEGICKISEDSVSCWTVSGAANPTLEEQMKGRLGSKNPNAPYVPPLTFKYGHKNRYVVAHTSSNQPTPGSTYVSVRGVADTGVGSLISLTDGYKFEGKKITSSIESALPVSADLSAKTTSLRVSEIQSCSKTALLDPRKGAACEIDGHTIRVTSIQLEKHEKRWVYKVSITSRNPRPFNLTCRIADKKGQDLQILDVRGAPAILNQPLASSAKAHGRRSQRVLRQFRSPNFVMTMVRTRNGAQAELVSNVNPAMTPKLLLNGHYTREIDIVGLALDPR